MLKMRFAPWNKIWLAYLSTMFLSQRSSLSDCALERDYIILFRPYVYTIELLLCWSGWKTANYLIITKTIMVLLEGSFEIGVTTGQDTHNRFKHLYLNNSDGWLRVHPMNCNHNSLCTVQGPRCLLACCTLTSLCTSSCGLNEQKTILK